MFARPVGPPGPAAGRAFATFLPSSGGEGDMPSIKTPAETDVKGDTLVDGTVAVGPDASTSLAVRTETVAPGAPAKTDAPKAPHAATLPRDDAADTGPATAPSADASPKPGSAILQDEEPTRVIARGGAASVVSSGDGRTHLAGVSSTMPQATVTAPDERKAAAAKPPAARTTDAELLSDGQRSEAAQIDAFTPGIAVASGDARSASDTVAEHSLAPAQAGMSATSPVAALSEPALRRAAVSEAPHRSPALTAIAARGGATSPPAVAPLSVKAAFRAEEPRAVATVRSAAMPDRAVRVAPAIAATLAIPALPVAPPQAGVSTALAAAMGVTSDPLGLADIAPGASEPRAVASQATVFAPTIQAATAGHDIPRQIAVQIAQAAEGGSGGARGTVELSLSPEELGRVRLRLHPSEAGLSVTITADRPETLDLMRRNIDLLSHEFHEIGYEDTQFEFAEGGQGADGDDAATPGTAAPALTAALPDTAQTAPTALLMMSDGLDIRL